MPNSIGFSLLLVVSLMTLAGCERYPQGAEGKRVEVREDAGCKFDFVTYSLGVFGGGYFAVEIEGSEVLRFDTERTHVYGRCREDGTLLLVSLEPPIRDMREASPFEIEVQVDSTGDAFFNDDRLLRLG